MSIASIKAGKAFYEIFADDKTGKGLADAEARLMKFGARVGAVGASLAAVSVAGLTSITAMVKSFATAGDDLADAMSTTGLSGGFLQTLQYGAADAGVSADALSGSISKFNRLISAAASGSKSASATLAKLGFSAQQLLAMSPDDRIKAIATAIAGIQDPSKRAAAAMDMFGKSGAKLLPLLEGGGAGLAALQQDLESRGLVLSKEDIALAQEANGAFLLLGKTWNHIINLIGAAAAPVLIPVLELLQAGAEAIATFIDNNRWLVAGLTIGLGAIGAVGFALVGIGAAAGFVGFALANLAVIGATIGAVLASPFVLIAAAVIACGAAALTAAYHLDQLYNSGRVFNFLAAAAVQAAEAVGLVLKAMMAGEWTLARDFIAASIEAAFDGAILSMKQKWSDFLQFLGQDGLDLTADVADTTASALKAAELAAQIANLQRKKFTLPDLSLRGLFGGDGFGGGLQQLQTQGVLSAAAAGRLAQSSPANQFDRLIDIAEEHLQVAEETYDHIRDLTNLTVE